ncbi:hypothetical protein K502DRAFT_324417 [Neoconidiobolus thromboides FSU 785]|nr:hypothetical protein K502DRAFT_324417 [Neoconidiobolus thromboides FSU 785]
MEDHEENYEPMSKDQVDQVIEMYQNVIYNELRPVLEVKIKEREKIYNENSEYIKLKSTIEAMRISKQKEIKSKVELGCGVFAQANITDTRYIYINVGLGNHVQFTLLEALKFIDKRMDLLKKKSDKATKKVSELRARIQTIVDTLQTLMETSQ